MKRLFAVLFVAGLSTALFAGGSQSSGSSPARTELVYAVPTDVSSLDPRNGLGTVTAGVLADVFSVLVKTDEKGAILPDLAGSYKNVNDTTWEFKLREDVVFHDGSKFTAEDVKYTFDTIRDKTKTYSLGSDYSFIRAEIVDPFTVHLVTDEPFAGLLLRLGNVKILPKAYVEKVGDAEFAARPIGSGPYKFVERRKDDRVVLEANPDYFGTKAAIKRVVLRVIPEAASRIAALESGEVDIISNVATSQVARLKASRDSTVLAAPTTRVMFFGINLVKQGGTPLLDKRVRQALNYAVNKQTIIDGVLDGYGTLIATISTPEYAGYDASITPYEYDPDKARQLLAEAGYAAGFPLELSVTPGYLNGQDLAQAVAAQLGEAGLKVSVIEEDSNQQRDKITKGTVSDLYFNGIGGPYSNIDLVAKIAFGTGERYSTYKNAEFDALRKKAAATINEQEGNKLWSQLQSYIKDEAPAIFTHQQFGIYAYNNRVKNWKARTDEMIIIAGASF
jgi:peptide/nickel transport system substrate-binding protein